MKFTYFVLPALALANPVLHKRNGILQERAAACPQNQCLISLLQMTVPANVLEGDCASYLHTTLASSTSYYSATSILKGTSTNELDVFIRTTSTATATSLVTTTATTNFGTTKTKYIVSQPQYKRDAAPATPTYASVCTAVADYSAACSCLAVLPSTSKPPIAKVTSTTTSTAYQKTITIVTTALTVTSTTTSFTSATTTSTAFVSSDASKTTTISEPQASAFKLVNWTGQSTGQYLKVASNTTTGNREIVQSDKNQANADEFYLGYNRELMSEVLGIQALCTYQSTGAMVLELPSKVNASGAYLGVYCSEGYSNGMSLLTCFCGTTPTGFVGSCDQDRVFYTPYQLNPQNQPEGCGFWDDQPFEMTGFVLHEDGYAPRGSR